MKKNIIAALISVLALSTHTSNARETVVTTGIGTGIDYSDRNYDDDTGEGGEIIPPPPRTDLADEQSNFVISPFISITTKSSSDSAMLSFRPDINYDLIESEAGDFNHEAGAGFTRDLTDSWDFKFSNLFINTNDYENYRPMEKSQNDEYLDSLLSRIPSMNDRLRDDSGRRRYSRNDLNLSTGYEYSEDGRVALGYGWDYLRYDEDDLEGASYQDYDKYYVSLAGEQDIGELWTVRGYGQYLRGIYDTDGTSDDDLDEYHLGIMGETRIIPSHPLTLSYDFSEADYDDETVDNSSIHKMTLGYRLMSIPSFEMRLGAGPTYTETSDSETSWDANGMLDMRYKYGQGSVRLTSDIGTRFDNFSGTEDRGLTNYWSSKLELSHPLYQSVEASLYGGYSDENRDDVEYDAEYDVELLSAGAALKYRINERYDVGLNYDYTIQDSERIGDSYDEHTVRLMMSYKTDLFTW